MENFDAIWNYPTQIHMGIGKTKTLPALCAELNILNPLFVTDSVLAESSMFQLAVSHCLKQGLGCETFSHVASNPTDKNVMAGVDAFLAGRHDGIIAFGGGSSIDAGKAIAFMVDQSRPLWGFEDGGGNWRRANTENIAPVIALPTTAGTGSEVGRVSVITDSKLRVKRLLFHPSMMPDKVILDPELTKDLPPHLTAATGMDALSHALEAYCSPNFHPMADGIALEAIRLIQQYLTRAFKNGQDMEARANMMVASTMGATAFQKGLGAMHALAHPLGGQFNAHHGLLNAILMPYIVKANRAAIQTRIERLARHINLGDTSFDGFLLWLLNLRRDLAIPHSLKEIEVDDAHASLIGQMAFDDPSAAGNPISFTPQEYEQIFTSAVRGQL